MRRWCEAEEGVRITHSSHRIPVATRKGEPDPGLPLCSHSSGVPWATESGVVLFKDLGVI